MSTKDSTSIRCVPAADTNMKAVIVLYAASGRRWACDLALGVEKKLLSFGKLILDS